MVVIRGPRPIVVDPGSLTDTDVLPDLLDAAGTPAADVSTVVCSHYHSDHVGAVATLQDAGAQVAAHAWDAAMVNARDPQLCASAWLEQPVLPYHVERALTEGDVVSTGLVDLEVLHTPGHTLGGISLWEPETRTLVCGDALHAGDVPWIGSPHEGAGSLVRSRLTLDRIEQLDPITVISGHGPVIDDVAAVLAYTRERLDRWAADPSVAVMHAAKRILTYRLMLEPIPHEGVRDTVAAMPWCRDLAGVLGSPAEQLADSVLEGLAKSTEVVDGELRTKAPHRQGKPISWNLLDAGQWPPPPAAGVGSATA